VNHSGFRAAFGGLRRRRNELEYPDYPAEKASIDEAAETLQTACRDPAQIIHSAARTPANNASHLPNTTLDHDLGTGVKGELSVSPVMTLLLIQ
jgi:hypothetical protein